MFDFVGPDGGRVANLSFGGPNGVDIAARSKTGGPMEIEGVIIEGSRASGLFYAPGGAGGTVRDVVIRNGGGHGIGVSECQPVHIDGLQVSNVGGGGVIVFNEAASPERGTRVENARISHVGSHGVQFSECGGSSVSRVHVSAASIDGVVAIRRTAPPQGVLTVKIEDLWVVEGDDLDPADVPLRGLEIFGGQRVEVRRVGLIGPKQCSFLTVNSSEHVTDLEIDQLYVTRTSPPLHAEGSGYGMAVMGNIHAVARRVVVDRAEGVGPGVSTWRGDQFPELTLEDPVMHDTLSPNGIEAGYGIMAFDGAKLVMERVLLAQNRDLGLLVNGWGQSPETRVTATNLTVVDTEPASCKAMASPPMRCAVREQPELAGGSAVLAGEGGRLTLERFRLEGSSKSGLIVNQGGIVRGAEGLIARNAIGINLLDADYDVKSLRDVRFEGNSADVGQQQIRPPDPGGLLAEVAQ